MTNGIDLDALAELAKPCPFCGQALEHRWSPTAGKNRFQHPVRSLEEGMCPAADFWAYEADPKLDRWNRRAAIPSEQGEAVADVRELAERARVFALGPSFVMLGFNETIRLAAEYAIRLDRAAEYAIGLDRAARTAPAAGVKVKALPDDNDGVEQDAFEEWAKAEGFDMEQHPLHWLFLNKQTSAARKGWRAALRHAHARILSALDQGEPK